jgi:hypothetical protein
MVANVGVAVSVVVVVDADVDVAKVVAEAVVVDATRTMIIMATANAAAALLAIQATIARPNPKRRSVQNRIIRIRSNSPKNVLSPATIASALPIPMRMKAMATKARTFPAMKTEEIINGVTIKVRPMTAAHHQTVKVTTVNAVRTLSRITNLPQWVRIPAERVNLREILVNNGAIFVKTANLRATTHRRNPSGNIPNPVSVRTGVTNVVSPTGSPTRNPADSKVATGPAAIVVMDVALHPAAVAAQGVNSIWSN